MYVSGHVVPNQDTRAFRIRLADILPNLDTGVDITWILHVCRYCVVV